MTTDDHHIGCNLQNLACLVREWPGTPDGEAYVTALMVCDAVLSRGEDDKPEHARDAFIEAAREAGFMIDEVDGPDWF